MLAPWSQALAQLGDGYLHRVVETLLLLLLFFSLRAALSRIGQGVIRDAEKRFQFVKYARMLLKAVLVLCLYQVWLDPGWSVASFIGLISAGFAIVLREPLLNLAGWVFILTRRPFNLGDRVQIGELYAGDVVDIGSSDFTLMEIGNWVEADQSTGRIVHVPNGLLFTQALANYSEGFPLLWTELAVLLTYESDWSQAVAVLQRIADEQCEVDQATQERTRTELAKFKRYMISYTHLTPSVYVSKDPSGVLLTVRYLCEPRRRRSSESKLWQAIYSELLGREDIQFAYPTRRFVSERSDRTAAPHGHERGASSA